MVRVKVRVRDRVRVSNRNRNCNPNLTLTFEWWQRCGEAVGTGQLARNAQLGLHLVRVRVRG